MPLFGSSGIRAVFDQNLIQLALKTGLAVGTAYRSIVVGRDTRTSSEAMEHAFISGLLAAGAKVAEAGTVPTPTVAFASREFSAGAMITASHNPPEYNGIKLLNPDGSAFDSHLRQQTEEAVLSNSFSTVPWSEIKTSTVYPEAIEKHISAILTNFPEKFKLKVVVDCGCGAASLVTPCLLTKLGCEVVALNCYPSGFFPRNIEPVAANLGDLIKTTTQLNADLGIAHDGDGDRMIAIDDKGRFVSGDKLWAIFAQVMGAKRVVTTIDASMAIEEMGFTVTRTKVGDIYVSQELKKGGDFGGEPSGSWLFPHFSLCPDGIYAAAQLVAIASQKRLSSLADNVPDYPLLRGSLANEGLAMPKLQERLAALKPQSMSDTDGVKLSFADGWLLIRASGTEPKIRVTVEARSEGRARQLYDSAVKIIKDSMREHKGAVD